MALGLTMALLPNGMKAWARSAVKGQVAPAGAAPLVGTANPDTPGSPTLPQRALRAADLLKTDTLQSGSIESQLLGVFASVEQGDLTGALSKSGALTRDHPNYQLGQLVHGDLLKLRYDPAAQLGGISGAPASPAATTQLNALRTETRKRLEALHNRPPSGTVPHQFVALSGWSRHAIAVDASQSRLYLFENQAGTGADSGRGTQLKLVADFFISVGKSGVGKQLEGDGRTPVGNYHITSMRDRSTLPPLYGAGALPINYPNAFDVQQQRTGFGIWLHGTPPNQFVRAPQASDGCVVLSNPDMQQLLKTVALRSTPVVIANSLQWTDPTTLEPDRNAFVAVLEQWQRARSQLTASEFQGRFGPTRALATDADATSSQRVTRPAADPSTWLVSPDAQLGVTQVSLLQSRTPEHTMVATFEETLNKVPTGVIRRQYWQQSAQQWLLLQDTVLAGDPSAMLKRQPVTTAMAEASSAKPTPEATTQAISRRPTEREKPPRPAPNPRAAGAQAEDEAIRHAVLAWAKAWSDKNMGGYLKAYDSRFETPSGQNRKAWEQERRDRILPKSNIRVQLSKMAIHTQGSVATVRFVQSYQADQLNVSSRKTLTLAKRGNQWLITQEQVGR